MHCSSHFEGQKWNRVIDLSWSDTTLLLTYSSSTTYLYVYWILTKSRSLKMIIPQKFFNLLCSYCSIVLWKVQSQTFFFRNTKLVMTLTRNNKKCLTRPGGTHGNSRNLSPHFLWQTHLLNSNHRTVLQFCKAWTRLIDRCVSSWAPNQAVIYSSYSGAFCLSAYNYEKTMFL